jgi:hypothetical protein
LHFDISELYSRKLRKKLSSQKFTRATLSSELPKIISEFFKQRDQFQDLYDSETNHGTIEKKQKRWEEKVNKEPGGT